MECCQAFDGVCRDCGCPVVRSKAYGYLCRECHEAKEARIAREEEEGREDKDHMRDLLNSEDEYDAYYDEIDEELKGFDE